MMKKETNLLLQIDNDNEDKNDISFCKDFIHSSKLKYVYGTNEYAASIATQIKINGFIDDFTSSKEFMGKPIIKFQKLPKESIVVSAVVLALPLTVLRRLKENGIRHIDYFAFKKYSGLNLKPVIYHHGNFRTDFEINREHYDKIYNLLADDLSRKTMIQIINFRLSNDIKYMHGFVDATDQQYFEEFLNLKTEGESFADVGCFDGYTSLEFIKRCPNYDSVHVFEPEPNLMKNIKKSLEEYSRIIFHDLGLSNQTQNIKFTSQGSSSKISTNGDIEIKVKRLDDIIKTPITFLKMDIEGGEKSALEGAKQTIKNYHPRLAISVYHCFDDLWRIPQQILSYRKDYKIYLRHYTEGVTETVMFFMPI